jgi:prevent-host-death family protein
MGVDLRSLGFLPLSRVKATLSQQVRELRPFARRLVITSRGQPVGVLVAYDEFLAQHSERPEEEILDFESWERDRPRRERVRDSILELFDVPALSRKGQKRYKREAVRALRR